MAYDTQIGYKNVLIKHSERCVCCVLRHKKPLHIYMPSMQADILEKNPNILILILPSCPKHIV